MNLKALEFLKSLPKHKQRFADSKYTNAQGHHCVLGALSPTLAVAGFDCTINCFYDDRDSILNLSIPMETKLKVREELSALGIDKDQAKTLQRLNDYSFKHMTDRFRHVCRFLEDGCDDSPRW